jgi:ParB family chromosome partitioning protein
MNNTNLGKGLDELFGTPLTNIENSHNIQNIDLELIRTAKYQPRSKINPESLGELASSIKEKGVIQPILVKESQQGLYEIIAGERRYLASLAIKKESIPALILDISENEAFELALIENIQRDNLNPIEEANAIRKLIKDYNYKQDDIGKKLGKSRAHIANILRLLSLPQAIQDMVTNKDISMGHARALVKKDNALEIAKKIVADNLSVRDVENLLKTDPKKEKKELLNQHNLQKKLYFKELENRLKKEIDHKIKITHDGKKGKILIEYKNNSDLENFVNLILGNVSRETR